CAFSRITADHDENGISHHVSTRTARNLIRHKRQPHGPRRVALGCGPDRVAVRRDEVVHVLFRISGNKNVHYTRLFERARRRFPESRSALIASTEVVTTEARDRVLPSSSVASY